MSSETPAQTTDSCAEPKTLVACKVEDLEVGQAGRFDVGEYRFAIVRGEDRWHAIDDECTHADYSLAEGDVDLDDCTIECWKHGSLFSLITGQAETLPATRPVHVYPVQVEAGEVVVTIDAAAPRRFT